MINSLTPNMYPYTKAAHRKEKNITNHTLNTLPAAKVKNGLDVLSNYNKGAIFFTGRKQHLDKYVNNFASHPNLLESLSPKMFISTHEACFKDCFITSDEQYIQKNVTEMKKCAWKIHLYSNDFDDWKNLSTVVLPYLNDKGAVWKTYNILDYEIFEQMNEDKQSGKAITIYPKSANEFKKIASDISYIIRNNNLEREDTKIRGDRQLGTTGRIFYRYEYDTKDLKDKIFDYENEDDIALSQLHYEANRDFNNYLASDMTKEDDPWYNFDPEAY